MASILVPVASSAAAESLVATDSFDRTVSGGLGSAPTGGTNSVAGDASRLSVSGGNAIVTGLPAGTSIAATLPSAVSLNTQVTTSVAMPSLATAYYSAEVRRQSDGTAYRGRVRIGQDGTTSLSVSRVAQYNETSMGRQDLPLKVQANQKLWLDVAATGTAPVTVKVRAWVDGASRPDWQYTVSDGSGSAVTSAGGAGFWTYASSGGPVGLRVGELTVTDLGTSSGSTSGTTTVAAAATTTSRPSASNTGVPSGTGLSRYTGPLTITTDGTVIDGKDIYGDLKVQARNVTIRNSALHCGTGNPTSNTGCIDANSGNVYNLLIENNTIKPDNPSYYRDGIVGHEFTARGNNISGSNDGIGIFNKPGGSLNANVTVTGNYIHDLKHFNTDPAHSDGTHNDAIQIQGGTNIAIRGNSIVASASGADGSWTYNGHANSAIMISQNVSALNNVTIENNWINKGQAGVAVSNGKYATVKLTLQNNAFGRDQYAYNGNSRYQVRIYNKAATTITGLTTNTFQDTGARLAEGASLGIRYG